MPQYGSILVYILTLNGLSEFKKLLVKFGENVVGQMGY